MNGFPAPSANKAFTPRKRESRLSHRVEGEAE